MTYAAWKTMIAAAGWTFAQLRCDVPPDAEMLEAMDTVGLDVWEHYVLRLEKELTR